MRAFPRWLLAASTAALLLCACERSRGLTMATPYPTGIRLPSPDPSFRLTPAQRALVRPGFDVNALERLLASIIPEGRMLVLKGFQFPAPGQASPMVVEIGDPALKPLLDEVWLPMWQNDLEALKNPGYEGYEADFWPGLELARQRAGIRAGPPPPRPE